jgi:methionine-rich copper-binding protein CopC
VVHSSDVLLNFNNEIRQDRLAMLHNSILTASGVLVICSLILLTMGLFSYDNTAYGHANPVSYSPTANSIISGNQDESLPAKVMILFSERPEPKVSYIHVTNSKNQRVDNNDLLITGQNDREATVALDKSRLSDGVYTVSWLVLSRDDGHITKGSYVFNIQQQQLQQLEGVTSASSQNSNNTFSDQTIVDNVNMSLLISPLHVGLSTFNVTLADQSGNPVSNIRNVILSFINKEVGLGPIVANLNKTDVVGMFTASGSYLSQPGEWEIKVTAQRSGEYDLNHTFKTTVNGATTAS